MAGFFLTLTTSVFFSADAPNIEVLVNGVVSASFIETELEGSGSTTRTLYIDYVGLSPSDITVQINDASGETGRYLVLEAVAVNGQNIRNNTLNVNDGTPVDLLTTLESMDFDTTNTDWLFGQTEPLLSYFGTSTYPGKVIHTGFAINEVFVIATKDSVIAIPSIKLIHTGFAINYIIVVEAIDEVITCTTIQRVVSFIAVENVIAKPSIQDVITKLATQFVISIAAD